MKFVVKFFSDPLVYYVFAGGYLYLMLSNNKFMFTSLLIGPFAATMIWSLNWKAYKDRIIKSELKIGRISYIFAFIIDIISWPLALIRTSTIILDDGEKNV